MKFGSMPLDDARGGIMAHSQRVGETMIRKGALLDDAAIDALRAAGRAEVTCAMLEPGDVPEDIAADRLATPLVTPMIGRSRAATGRVNLSAQVAGLLRVDTALIDQLNAIDESLTIGTLPDYAVVAPKDLVATIKIVPFSVPGALLARAEDLGRKHGSPLSVSPFKRLRVGLVATQLPGLKDSTTDKTIEVTEQRVKRLTGSLLPPVRCPHDVEQVARALRGLLDDGADMLLVVGASAVLDRRDVGPAGIVRAGGDIVHFGMPVDPGNLICVCEIEGKPALVLPGCARSPKLNGIDFILTRLFAGLKVTSADIMRMGVGGLLKEFDRGLPREKAPATPRIGAAPRSAPAIAAVVLAAGKSSRMAPYNKLLVDSVLSSNARPILVVTGHMADEVRQALGGRPVRYVHAPDYANGLAESLKAGIAAVPPECSAAIVCLGDMPLVTGRMIDRMLSTYDPDEGRLIVLPTFQGKQGNPTIWDRRFFPEILGISGDAGARSLVRLHAEAVAEVEIGDDAVLRDFDTAESLNTLPERMRPVGVT
jgi:molybdenum cofactor cytidylyltransferase